MSLRVLTNAFFSTLSLYKKNLLFLLMFLSFTFRAQEPAEVNALKKEAKKYFDDEDYTKAYPLYSQLVANYAKDPELNYRLGVCMIFSEADKKKCLTYLNFASKNFESPPKELPFYLGKGYHINYLFDDALKHYTEFKNTASSSLQKKMQVDREIAACTNGKRLLSNLSDVAVRSKKQLNEADYFRTYDLRTIGGKLLVKPDEFKTPTDKKKKEKSVVFLPKNSNIVYFSSYGENAENGKDIFTCFKQADGNFSKPVRVNGINTAYDEDYPFLHPDGKSLYFASKGHNSMGGYDIFKSVYNETTNAWSTPENLEFPINSPDDDYLFVTDSLEKTAFFSTGRQSPPGKIDVLKINIERKPINLISINGKAEPAASGQAVTSKVIVKLLNSIKIVGEFESDENGNYAIELPKGEYLVYTVETPGFSTQSHTLNVPLSEKALSANQTIQYENSKLKISTNFDADGGESNYLQYLKLIEEKAKLDVNTDDTQPQAPLVKGEDQKTPKNSSGPQLIEDSGIAAANPKQLNNKELSLAVKSEAIKAEGDYKTFNQDSKDAYQLADQYNSSANDKWDQAQKLLSSADQMQDETEKEQAIEKATALKKESQQEKALALKMLDYGKSMEEDAGSAKKFADLNSEFATALNTSKSSNLNKDPNLKTKQSAVIASKTQPTSLAYEEALNKKLEDKEKEAAGIREAISNAEKQSTELGGELLSLEASLAKTKKKSAKESLTNQIEDLKTEQAQNEKQNAILKEKLLTVNDELNSLKLEKDAMSRIKSETIALPPAAAVSWNANTSPNVLKEKYKDVNSASNTNDIALLEQNNLQLKAYTEDITALQETKRRELAKTKSAKLKQDLSRDIKQLESMKMSNAQMLSKNEYVIENLKNQAKTNEPVNFSFTPLNLETSKDLASQLDNLNKQLEFNDASNFKYDTYTNETAKTYKSEADAALRGLQEKQNKLRVESNEASETFRQKKSTSPEQLEAESDSLMSLAGKKRLEASQANGPEKTKLLNESKSLEATSSEKLLQASEINRKDNSITYETNLENINNLIASKTAPPENIAKARNLLEEANIAYKQGASMREEANAFASAGAKLGNISNAEEKELEAFGKQKAAIDLLMTSNPAYELKQPQTSTNLATNAPDSAAISNKINAINEQLTEVLEEKLNTYQKLYDANDAEINQIFNEINRNSGLIENTPSLKAEYTIANKRKASADGFKQKGDNASDNSEKLSALVNATREQNNLIPLLNNLSNSIVLAIELSPQNTGAQANTPTQTTQPDQSITSLPENQNQKPLSIINSDSLLQQETNTKSVLVFLEKPDAGLINEQAYRAVKEAMGNLDRIGSQQSQINDNQKNAEALAGLLTSTKNPAELRTAAEDYENNAEQLSAKAFEKRKEANALAPAEKKAVMQESKQLESEAINQRFLASLVNQKAFDIEYKTNDKALNELKTLLNDDDGSLDAAQDQMNIDIQNLNSQVRKLKEEAASLPNRSAQLGALSNVEEKERELIRKQTDLIESLRKKYPDFQVQPLSEDTVNAMLEPPADNSTRQDELLAEEVTGLTNLTNALTLEFETSKQTVPGSLSTEQQQIVANADKLNENSKQLLLQASGEMNPEQKIKKMNQAALLGAAAVEQLAQVLPAGAKKYKMNGSDIDQLASIGEQVNGGNDETNGAALKVEGLEIVKGNAYNENKPIPFNSFKEEGLSFRVQIGAFRNQLPNNTFKGLSPLYGETTRNGYYRYTAGDFEKIEAANAVKNDLRKLGYRDAFVVAYLNGKRISASEAIAFMAKEGKFVDINSPQSAGITGNLNIPKAILTENEPQVNPADLVQVTKEIEQINGLLYTIQIGVYTKQATKQGLLNLQPIYTKQLPNGLFRYTAGIYNDTLKVVADRNRIVELGISDAFVGAYLNGNGISFTDGKKRQNLDPDVRMENQNPVVFPEGPVNPPVVTPEVTVTQTTDPNVQPFKNNVSTYPEATETNGVKADEAGVSFKVQIGAFSKQVPNEVAANFMKIKTWPVEYKQINGLFVYNVGNFSNAAAAKALKNELVQLGITDAFVVVYRDGRKIYGAEASTLLSR
jgi:hypothetical protein